MKREHAIATAGALVLGVLWAVHPAGKNSGSLRPPKRWATPSEGASHDGDESKASLVLGSQRSAFPAAKDSVPTAIPSAPELPMPKVGPSGGRWDHMRYLEGIRAGQGEAGCQQSLRRTASHLSIDASRVSDFEVAARQSVLEMEQALDLRERELSAMPPAQGSSGLSEAERLSRERYAAARAKALHRLETFLAQSPAQQEFRWAFDSWALSVAGKALSLGR